MKNSPQKPVSHVDPAVALHGAVREGNVDAVTRILKANQNCVDSTQRVYPPFGRTPLHNAAMFGFCDVVKVLLQHGATVDARTWSDSTPLIFAAEKGHVDVIAALLNADANIDSYTSTNAQHHIFYSPLHKAASLENCDALHLLVAKGASVTRRAVSNTSALHIAAKNGRRLNVIILCAFGCDPYLRDSNGKTAFGYADELDQPFQREIKRNLKEWSSSSRQERLSSLRTNLVKFVNDAGKINIHSLLIWAAEEDDEIIMMYAIEIGSREIIDWKDTRGRAALHQTVKRANVKTLELLLDNGADINCRTGNRKWTALLMATEDGHESVVRSLLQHGADLEAKTETGLDAMTIARKKKHTQIVELLETWTKSRGLTVPPSRNPSRRSSPISFQMVRADKEAFEPPTTQALMRVRIVRPPSATGVSRNSFHHGPEPKKSPEAVSDAETEPDSALDVNGGFDGELFSKIVPSSGLVQPKTFDELIKTWRVYFDFKEADKKIRIAVLDTGIDLDHDDWLQPRAVRFENGKPVPASGEPKQIDRIKNKRNFCGGDETDVQDLDGHGTQVAGIILRLAPRAEVDIARVCIGNRNRGTRDSKGVVGSSAERCPQPSAVAKAIDWAIETHADIINMSFGYEHAPKSVREALIRAQRNKIVVFAAMSNGGSYEKAKWPARDNICAIGVHSCDENGTRSGFTPLPNPNAQNFMVVGENIVTHWPKAKGGAFRLDDGTSFATPTAAAMAALVLSFVEQKICKPEREKAQEFVDLEELRENSGMIALLRSISIAAPDSGYLLIHHELLWRNLPVWYERSKGKCRSHAWDLIQNALIP
ncbi:ankyrin [Jackrogersella minutella]|nr:ankyrin [Jackrogersella minutella]